MNDYESLVKAHLDNFQRYRAHKALVNEALAGRKSRRPLLLLQVFSRALTALLVSLR